MYASGMYWAVMMVLYVAFQVRRRAGAASLARSPVRSARLRPIVGARAHARRSCRRTSTTTPPRGTRPSRQSARCRAVLTGARTPAASACTPEYALARGTPSAPYAWGTAVAASLRGAASRTRGDRVAAACRAAAGRVAEVSRDKRRSEVLISLLLFTLSARGALHCFGIARLPNLRRDWAQPAHLCAGTGARPRHICAGTGARPCNILTRTSPTPATSAPGLGLAPPHLRLDRARPAQSLHSATTHNNPLASVFPLGTARHGSVPYRITAG